MNWTMVGVFVAVAIQTIYLSNWLSSQVASIKVALDNLAKGFEKLAQTVERHSEIFVRKDELLRQISERNREIDELREQIKSFKVEFVACKNGGCK